MMSVHDYLMPDPGWQQVAATVAVGALLAVAAVVYVVTGVRSALGSYDEALGPATPAPSATATDMARTATDSAGSFSEPSEAVLVGVSKQ